MLFEKQLLYATGLWSRQSPQVGTSGDDMTGAAHTSWVLTDPSCFRESPSNGATQVSGHYIALDLSWMSADVSITVPPTNHVTQPRTLTSSWRWPETSVTGHPLPSSHDSDRRLAGYRNFPKVWSMDLCWGWGGSLEVYKWSAGGGDLREKKGWNDFTHSIQVQNWLRFSQQSHYVLNNCHIFQHRATSCKVCLWLILLGGLSQAIYFHVIYGFWLLVL